MSLLDRFRKKGPLPVSGEPTPLPVPAPALPDALPLAAPAMAEIDANNVPPAKQTSAAEPTVRAFDEFGREVLVPVSQWRAELLPNALQQAHNDPDALSGILLDALQTGAAEQIVTSAAHLQAIDTVPERGAAVHGLVLLAAGKAAESEDVLVTYLGQFGPSASVLTHLARAQAAQNRVEEADTTIWRALEANPNDDGALGLYAARSREREGDFGWQSALERAATLPGAWLPLLWLGRSALDARNRTLAVGLYKQAIERAGRPTPVLLLQGVSGDLGQFGLLDDALRLVRPAYDPELHGLAVGSNLLRASLDSGQPAEAMALLRDLAKLNRPDFAPTLRAWEVEIRRRDLIAQANANPPQPQLLRMDGPLWLPAETPGRQLYATDTPRRGTVLFLGSSATLPEQLQESEAALPDTAARLSRALPLYLAENAYTLLTLETQTLVPWAEVAGFAMLSQPWPDEAAAAYARDAGARAAVTIHVQAAAQGATITLRVVPAAAAAVPPAEIQNDAEPASDSDASSTAAAADETTSPHVDLADESHAGIAASSSSAEVATVSVSGVWAEIANAAQALWPQLAIHLVSQFGDTPEPPRFGRYTPPRGLDMNIYLRLLEQLLAINCAMASRHAALLISGERETLRSLLDLALRYPNSLPVRLMLGELLLRLRALHPEVLGEFAQPLQLFNERHPFPDSEAATLLQAQTAAAMNPQPAENA